MGMKIEFIRAAEKGRCANSKLGVFANFGFMNFMQILIKNVCYDSPLELPMRGHVMF